MSRHLIWFKAEFKNQNFCPHTYPYKWGLGVGPLQGVPTQLFCLMCFTLEMATFELVAQHIA